MKKIPKSFEEFNSDLEKRVDRMMTVEGADVQINEAQPIPVKLKSKSLLSIDNDPMLDKAVGEIEKQDSGVNDDIEPLSDDQAKTKKIKKDHSKLKKKILLSSLFTILGIILIIIAAYFLYHPSVDLVIKDSQNGNPVSAAEVTLNGKNYQTAADGSVKVSVKIGPNKINVSKKYYTNLSTSLFEFFGSKTLNFNLVATGRIVNFKVVNAIDKSAINGAVIAYNNGVKNKLMN